MPTFTDPLREIDAASVKEYALQRGAAELSDDFVHEACQRVMDLAKPQATCQQCSMTIRRTWSFATIPFTVSSQRARQLIEDSAIVLMYAVTLGEAVEQEIDKLFMDKEITRGLASIRPSPLPPRTIRNSSSTPSMKPVLIKAIKPYGP